MSQPETMSNQRMNSEARRLSTFSNWQIQTIVDPGLIANAGFYATGRDYEVICHWCEKTTSGWKAGDRPMERHRRLNPICPFVLDQNNCDNIPVQPLPVVPDVVEPTSSESVEAKNRQRDVNSRNLKFEHVRLSTFKNWPITYITPAALARAGFYYFDSADRVQCAWCNIVVGQWEFGDNPFSEHQRLVPACPKVQLGPNLEIASNGIRDLGIQQIRAPKEPRFSSLDARLRSFSEWTRGDIQHPEDLAQAGFYYQGSDDQVRCFHCNGGLRYWMVDDDPWFEHARWFPSCQFVHLVKGLGYVKSVQDKPRCDTAMVEAPHTQIMTLDEAMSTDQVQAVLMMGLNVGRIRTAVKSRLEKTGKPFQDAESLIEAVLDGQIEEEDPADEAITAPPIRGGMMRRNYDSSVFPNDEHVEVGSNAIDYFSSYRMESTPTYFPPSSNPDPIPKATASVEPSAELLASPVVEKPETKVNNLESGGQISLEEENRKLKDARTCKICMDDEVGVVFLPCGHLVTCVQCAPGVTMCPLCRSSIKGFVRTFLS